MDKIWDLKNLQLVKKAKMRSTSEIEAKCIDILFFGFHLNCLLKYCSLSTVLQKLILKCPVFLDRL